MAAGGFVFQNYNESSSYQRRILLKATDALYDSLNYIKEIEKGTIVIADYGSSEAYNSMVFLSSILNKFRETSQQPVYVVHNDLPDNNWMKVFKTIVDSPESYRKVPNTFFSAIGLSFYEQILPEETVHVGFSSSAIHWLSEPLSAPDHIIPSASEDPEFLALASEHAHKDLVSILKLRYKELVSSGRLHLQFADRTHVSLISNIWQETTENLFSTGIINEEEKRDLTIPMYRRSPEEIQRALDEVHGYYRVLESKSVDMPRAPGRVSRQYIDHIKKFAAVSMKTPLSRAISKGQAEIGRIFEFAEKEIEEIVDRTDFENSNSSYYSIVLEKH